MNLLVRKPPSLSPLPAPGAEPPFALNSGTVEMFREADWTGSSQEVTTDRWPAAIRHNLAVHRRDHRAAWIAFNLPVGRVMTLTRHHRDIEDGLPACDLRDVAQVADLVGTGRTEAVDLAQIGMQNAVSSFFWRDVDLKQGAVELYGEPDFKGNRTVLFLSEWKRGELHSLADWAIEDRLGSVRWNTMPDMHYCDLFQHRDGIGKQYPLMSGWKAGPKERPDTSKYSFHGMVSAFRWDAAITDRPMISPVFMDILFNRENTMRTFA
jgi:hypothetical protein